MWYYNNIGTHSLLLIEIGNTLYLTKKLEILKIYNFITTCLNFQIESV